MSDQVITPVARALSIPDYELLRPIGRGAYGEVWLARNVTGSWVALKIVHRSAFDHDRPFEREFEGIKRFEPISRSDPSQVAILHVGLGEGFFYYVMELADDAERSNGAMESWSDGSTTRQQHSNTPSLHHSITPASYAPLTLKRLLNDRGALPAQECLAIALSLTRALAHLHGHGLVHRDVKPSNVIFVNGQAKLADIGLVTSVDATRSFVGTEGYLPPEGAGTPQADLYSLGKVLYEMSTGCDRKEFPALPSDIATRPDRDTLAELNAIVVRACQLDPRQRYAIAAVMLSDLELLQRGQSVRREHAQQRRWGIVKKCGFATAVVAILIAGVWLLSSRFSVVRSQRSESSTATLPVEVKSIAVLPFDNDSPDKADEYLGTQMAEELSSALTRIPELRVLGRDSASSLKKSTDRRAAGQQLKLSAALEGHVRKSGNQLQLTAQLVNTADGFVLWSETYDRDMAQIFGIQTDVVERVAQALNLKLTDTIRTRLAIKPTKNLEAYQLYLEGRYYWVLGSPNWNQAIERFQAAIRLDPNFAAAYAGLADCYTDQTHETVSGRESLPKALENARKAVELDDRLAEAHTALARVKCHYEYDWAGADKEFQMAIGLNPADATTQQRYSQYLDYTGQFDQAIAHAKLAKELDPLSTPISGTLAWNLFDARQYEQALAEFMGMLKLNQNNGAALDGSGWCKFAKGSYDEATALWEKGNRISGLSPEKNSELTQTYRQRGMRAYWIKQIEYAKEGANPMDKSPFWIACDYAMLGENDQAFAWLERAYEDRTYYMPWVAVEYRLYGLHSDPRFAALLKKMGLENQVLKK